MVLTQAYIKQVVQEYFKDKPVERVYLFGSYARGEADENSDIDLLFTLKKKCRIGYFGLATYVVDLENILHKKVDLVDADFMYPTIKKEVAKEKIHLA